MMLVFAVGYYFFNLLVIDLFNCFWFFICLLKVMVNKIKFLSAKENKFVLLVKLSDAKEINLIVRFHQLFF